ncbi:50S ribosomal protein L6 [Lentisphaerota bacterium WC36G]|nr:50S ribosomal protein L6 [Lentisphaerae bacterium WC36]
MSRVGNKPVEIPASVKVNIADNVVTVEGKDKLSMQLPPKVNVAIEDNKVVVTRADETRQSNAMQGLARSLINNMVVGVTEGFSKSLQIIGVGYRAQVSGQKLTLNIGYSHPIVFDIPKGITIATGEGSTLKIDGADKQLVGEVAATIRRYRKPEPYKGKGIRYVGEHISMKEGKSVGK